jgi:hypothetical protein
VCEAHLETTTKIRGVNFDSQSEWDAVRKIMEDENILPKTSRLERARRWKERNIADRLPSPSLRGIHAAGKAVKGALPYFRFRNATAAEIAETYGANIQVAPSPKPAQANWSADETRAMKAKKEKLAELIKKQADQQKKVDEAFGRLQGTVDKHVYLDSIDHRSVQENRTAAIGNLYALDQHVLTVEMQSKLVQKEIALLKDAAKLIAKAQHEIRSLEGSVENVQPLKLYENQLQEIQEGIKKTGTEVVKARIDTEYQVLVDQNKQISEALTPNHLLMVERIGKEIASQRGEWEIAVQRSVLLQQNPDGQKQIVDLFKEIENKLQNVRGVIEQRRKFHEQISLIDQQFNILVSQMEKMNGLHKKDVSADVLTARTEAIEHYHAVDREVLVTWEMVSKIARQLRKLQQSQSGLKDNERELGVVSTNSPEEARLVQEKMERSGKIVLAVEEKKKRIIAKRFSAETKAFEQEMQNLQLNLARVEGFKPEEGDFPIQAWIAAKKSAQAIKDQRLELARDMQKSVSFDSRIEGMKKQLLDFVNAAKIEEEKVNGLDEVVAAKLAEHDRIVAFQKAIAKRDQALREFENLELPVSRRESLSLFVEHSSVSDRERAIKGFSDLHQRLQTLIECQASVKRLESEGLVDPKKDQIQRYIEKMLEQGFKNRAEFVRATMPQGKK